MMSKRWLLLSLFPVALLLPSAARSQESDEQVIAGLGARWVAMVAADDVDGIVAMYADGARFMPPNAPTAIGPDAIRAGWAQMVALPILTFAPETIRVSESGDMALDIGTYHVEFIGPDGTTLSDDGKYAVTWVKENGEWKVFADIFNSDMPLE